jgi:hypothetical protein
MAIPSQFTQYSTVQNSYQRMMGGNVPAYSAPAAPQTSSPIGYNQPLSNLRGGGGSTTISTFSNLSPQQRIAQMAQKKFLDVASTREARDMEGRAQWDQGLSAIEGLNRGDQARIFEGYRNTGLIDREPTQWGTEEYRRRSQNPGELSNMQTVGTANRYNLSRAGINPNSIQNAYTRFLQGR